MEVGKEEGQRLTSFVVNIPSAPFKFEQAHNFIHLIQDLRNNYHTSFFIAGSCFSDRLNSVKTN